MLLPHEVPDRGCRLLKTQPGVAVRFGKLDAWLESVRQPGGYAGPVAHWWGSVYQYTGPGLDWRYQGILAGYSAAHRKTHQRRWARRTEVAAGHLVDGQRLDGGYRASRFEANPGSLGTPHEAAAAHGLLLCSDTLADQTQAQMAATRGLDHLIARLWDQETSGSFRDGLDSRGRVPNKLATMAEALMEHAIQSSSTGYLEFARVAVDDILRFQEHRGPLAGAVHQWAPNNREGDGRFFPYYNARCVPALVRASEVFEVPTYRAAAELILDFLDRTLNEDATWPQIVYANGRRAEFPHWVAPTADIILAYRSAGRTVPPGALSRLWHGQLATGGFVTADGFGDRFRRAPRTRLPDYRDVTAVAGWNDKVLRLLAELLPSGAEVPEGGFEPIELLVRVHEEPAIWKETVDRISLTRLKGRREVLYDWEKSASWASVCDIRLMA